LGTAFTYQGRIETASTPVNGPYDIQARLYEDVDAIVLVPGTVPITLNDVSVVNGLFSVNFDFGASVFEGEARFLELRVRPGSETGGFTLLSPLQRLAPVPQAIFANSAPWSGITGVPAQIADGLDADTLGALPCMNGQIAKRQLSLWVCADDIVGVAGWTLAGNAGTTGANFLGTTDNNALELRVNGQRAMRVEPGTTPNLLGGSVTNVADAGVVGATVSGGGATGSANNNRVADDFGTIGGGARNQAGDGLGTTSDHGKATVGGGYGNTATGNRSTVSGGENNYAQGNGATVVGGHDNGATGIGSTVVGGANNTAEADTSLAAGQRARANHSGSFVWADTTAADFLSLTNDSFNVRAHGGVRIQLNGSPWVCSVVAGGSWACSSDRNLKENFVAVDGKEVLGLLEDVPIQLWNAIGADQGNPHMGPMAQDFFAAFGLGDDDKSISTIDLDGVALAAIKGLHAITKEQQMRIQQLEARVGYQEPSATTLDIVGDQPISTANADSQNAADVTSPFALWAVAVCLALFALALVGHATVLMCQKAEQS
jgi:hypothetical protein